MRRREFITTAGAAAAWPLVAQVQRPSLPVVGVLHSVLADVALPGLLRGLSESGYVEGRDFAIERYSGEGRSERLPALARDLVARHVAVIVAAGGNGPVVAAQAATTAVPIVFFAGGDPVERHIVASLARPGGNVTGVTSIGVALEAKRVELLHELLPPAMDIGALVDSTVVDAAIQDRELQESAAAVHRPIHLARTAAASDIDGAVAALAQQGARGLVVAQSPFFFSQRVRLVTAISRHHLPAVFHRRDFVEVGGLVSYGTDFGDEYRQVGVYVARILRGAHPGDLPVVQPTKFELVINLKTAKSLGLSVPDSLLATADDVIR